MAENSVSSPEMEKEEKAPDKKGGQGELWDLYSMDGTPTGQTMRWGDKVPEDKVHLYCEGIVRHLDGRFLIMKRAWQKALHPGVWQAGAGGCALAGETSEQCMERELKEETGLVPFDMRKLSTRVEPDIEGLVSVYVITVADDKIQLQEGETENYRWLTPKEFGWFMDRQRSE